jgi:hypothetical protein
MPGTFTDATLTAGSSIIKAIHITELRSRIDMLRQRFGLALYQWTDGSLAAGTTMVRMVHIAELRTALTDACAAAGKTPLDGSDAHAWRHAGQGGPYPRAEIGHRQPRRVVGPASTVRPNAERLGRPGHRLTILQLSGTRGVLGLFCT